MTTTRTEAYETGYCVAAMEIMKGRASHAQARDRGLFKGLPFTRLEWDKGYEDCVCAYRLGYNPYDLISSNTFGVAALTPADVITRLLNGAWEMVTRPDPRK